MSAMPDGQGAPLRRTPIRVGISARHVHLSKEHMEVLFGPAHPLRPKSDLSQPGQYAAQETVVVAGPGGAFPNVRVLGPVRSSTQVEVSASDCRTLGFPAVVRDSGDLAGTPGCVLIGPAGTVVLERGVIVAARHMHMTPYDATLLGLVDRALVPVLAGEGSKLTMFANVLVRVSENYRLELHLDVDEANAAGVASGGIVWMVDSRGVAMGDEEGRTQSAEASQGQGQSQGSGTSPRSAGLLDLSDRNLITEDDVIEAWRKGLAIAARAGALITPLAHDALRERRVELITS